MNIDEMDRSANAAAQLLKALASPVRLKILCQLVDGEKAVGQLAELLQARDALVSQHLALLRKDGLVRTRREAQTIWYSIASPAACPAVVRSPWRSASAAQRSEPPATIAASAVGMANRPSPANSSAMAPGSMLRR